MACLKHARKERKCRRRDHEAKDLPSFYGANRTTASLSSHMAVHYIRKGMPQRKLDRTTFERRYLSSFSESSLAGLFGRQKAPRSRKGRNTRSRTGSTTQITLIAFLGAPASRCVQCPDPPTRSTLPLIPLVVGPQPRASLASQRDTQHCRSALAR